MTICLQCLSFCIVFVYNLSEQNNNRICHLSNFVQKQDKTYTIRHLDFLFLGQNKLLLISHHQIKREIYSFLTKFLVTKVQKALLRGIFEIKRAVVLTLLLLHEKETFVKGGFFQNIPNISGCCVQSC